MYGCVALDRESVAKTPCKRRYCTDICTRKVHKPESGTEYPPEIRESAAKRAFYDHLNGDTVVANQIYAAVMSSKQDNFRGSKIKERKIWRAIRAVVKDDQEADQLLALVKEQSEF